MANHRRPFELDCLKIKPLMVALLLVFPVLVANPAQAVEGSAANLPDLGEPAPSQARLQPKGQGLSFENNFDRQKWVVSPGYSRLTGFDMGVSYAALLDDLSALGLVLSLGSNKKDAVLNLGLSLDAHQRLILSAGQLKQSYNYYFLSGTEKAETTLNSGGLSYQYQFGQGALRSLEVNAYVAETASRDLGAKTYAVDSSSLYELWSDPRRIAGGRISGIQGRLGYAPFTGSLFNLSFGAERLGYDLLTGWDSVTRATGGLAWTQQLGDGNQIKAGAESLASQTRFSAGLERSFAAPGGRHSLSLALVSLKGRDGIGNDEQIKFSYSYAFGVGGGAAPDAARTGAPGRDLSQQSPQTSLTAAPQPTGNTSLLDQVAQRPNFMPSHVLSKLDNTAPPTRLIAVNKAALPVGSSVDPVSGAVTAPLGVAVSGIVGVTKNGAAFTNTGQFSLSGNSLVVNPGLITQPAVGVVDTYVVTLGNMGGGTTLATVSISHGSVKIDSIVLANGDVTAPITVSAPSVFGTTNTDTNLSVTINENGTGYYLLLPADAAPPTVAAVRAGRAFTMPANVAANQAISGLTANTAYKIWFVAKDAANNVQAAVQSVAFTATANLPEGYLTQGGLTWTPDTIIPTPVGINSGVATWREADAFCAGFSVNGMSGWRLPTMSELQGLFGSGAMNGVPDWELGYVWSTDQVQGSHFNLSLRWGLVGRENNSGLQSHLFAFDYANVSCVR